jgi:two-component system cell cycle sensor histidine kinase/response regulator CckA
VLAGQRQLRVLLVEDNDIVRMLAVKMLEADGHEVVAAASAEEALALEPAASMDLVITDIVLPGLNGYELLDRLLEQRTGFGAIVTSGHAEPATLPPIRGARVCFLPKPYLQDDLRYAIGRVSSPLRGPALETPGASGDAPLPPPTQR